MTNRPTSPIVELIDCSVEQPTIGAEVIALQLGGCLIQVVWSHEVAKYCEAWMKYPKIPQTVKDRMGAKYAPK